MGENRERFLDIAKGIAIICIVLLHVEEGVIPTSLNTFIGSFMISMFYITTGWLDGDRGKVRRDLLSVCAMTWHGKCDAKPDTQGGM